MGSNAPLSGLRFQRGGKPRGMAPRPRMRQWPASTSLARTSTCPGVSGISRGSQRTPASSKRAWGTLPGLRRRAIAWLARRPARSIISETDMQRRRFQYHSTWLKVGVVFIVHHSVG